VTKQTKEDKNLVWLKTLPEDEQQKCIWELTQFPCFFSPKDGKTANDCFVSQLAVVKKKLEAGQSIDEQIDEEMKSSDKAMERLKLHMEIEDVIKGTIKDLNEVN